MNTLRTIKEKITTFADQYYNSLLIMLVLTLVVTIFVVFPWLWWVVLACVAWEIITFFTGENPKWEEKVDE